MILILNKKKLKEKRATTMMKCLQRPGRFPHIFLFNLKTWARSLHQELVAIVKKPPNLSWHGFVFISADASGGGRGILSYTLV